MRIGSRLPGSRRRLGCGRVLLALANLTGVFASAAEARALALDRSVLEDRVAAMRQTLADTAGTAATADNAGTAGAQAVPPAVTDALAAPPPWNNWNNFNNWGNWGNWFNR